jgi:HEAT repeat protein
MFKRFRFYQLIIGLFVTIFCLLICSAFQHKNGVKPAITDSKQKSTTDSLRSIVTGFEAYNIDFNTYPQELYQLTTPVAYLLRIPEEPYGGTWIVSFSDDSIYLTVQSSTHPEYNRSFVNENLLWALSEEKLIQLILNAEQREVRHRAALDLIGKNQQLSKQQSLASYFARQTQELQNITTRINATEVMGTVFYYYSSVTEFNMLRKNLVDINPRIRATTIMALNPFRLPDNRQYMQSEKLDVNLKVESDIMKFLVQDTSSIVREASAEALGIYAPEPNHRIIISLSLLTALNDPEVTVRASAANALGRQARYVADSTVVITKLSKMAKQDKPPAQLAAISSLGEFKAKSATPLLLSYLSSDNPEIKNTAISALCKIGDPDAVEPMQHLLGSQFASIRKPLIIGLGKSADPKSVTIIQNWLNDPDPKIRATVVTTLGTIKSPQVKPILLTALQDTESEIRVVAAGSLNRIEPNLSNRTYLKQLSIPDKIKLSSGEFAMMRAGLEAYYIDNGRYPLVQHFPFVLTTPVAYISYIPVEPFYKTTITFYRYYTPPSGQEWMVASDGPDQITDIDLSQVHYNPFQSDSLKPFNYNPTNGLMSNGDIWHQGP